MRSLSNLIQTDRHTKTSPTNVCETRSNTFAGTDTNAHNGQSSLVKLKFSIPSF